MGNQAASGTGATQLLAPRGGAFSLWRGTVSEPDTPQGARAGGHGQTRGPRALPAVCCSLGGCEGQGSTKGRKRLHKGRFRLGGRGRGRGEQRREAWRGPGGQPWPRGVSRLDAPHADSGLGGKAGDQPQKTPHPQRKQTEQKRNPTRRAAPCEQRRRRPEPSPFVPTPDPAVTEGDPTAGSTTDKMHLRVEKIRPQQRSKPDT